MASDSIKKLVVSLGMDATGFQTAVANVNRQMKVVQSEFKAASANIGVFGKSTDSLKVNAESLNKQIDLQKKKIEALNTVYKKASEEKGQDSKATQDLSIQLNKARESLYKMENGLTSVNNKIRQNAFSDLNKQLELVKSEFNVAVAKVSDFGKSTDDLKLKSGNLSKQLEINNKQVDLYKQTIVELQRNTKDYGSELDKVKARMEGIKRSYEESARTTGENSDRTKQLKQEMQGLDQEYQRLNAALNANNSALRDNQINMNDAVANQAKIKNEIAATTKQIEEQSIKSFSKVGTSVRETGQTLQNSFAPAAATSSYWIGSMIKSSIDFETQTRRAASLAGGSYQNVKNDILDMAKTSIYSTSEVAGAFAELGAKGFDASKATAALPGILSAAAASGEDLGLTADTVTAALNSFKLEASQSGHVADVLAQAANGSAAGMTDMNYAFKYAAPVAKQLGISLEELAASTGIMADAGIKGEQAGTTLRSALLRLVDPPKSAKDALNELGVNIKNEKGEMKSMSEIVGELGKSMNGMTNAQKSAYLSTIFGTEAVSGMMVLMDAGPDKINKMTKSLENSGGASKKAADEMTKGWAGASKMMGSSIDVAQKKFTDALAPAIMAVAKVVGFLADAFSSLPGPLQTVIAGGTALTVAFLAVGAVTGIFINAIGGAILTLGTLSAKSALAAKALGLFSGVLSKIPLLFKGVGAAIARFIPLLISPWGLIVVAIVGVIALIIANWDSLKGYFKAFWEWIKGFFSKWGPTLLIILTGPIGLVIAMIVKHWDSIKEYFNKFWEWTKAFFKKWGSTILIVITGPIGLVVSFIVKNWETIKKTTKIIWDMIVGLLKAAANKIKSVTVEPIEKMVDIIEKKFKQAKDFMVKPLEKAQSEIKKILDKIKSFFDNLKLKIPKPKIPKISVTEGKKNIGGVSVPYPKFDVEWHKYGGFFDKPTLAGLGEAGKEAAVPLVGRRMDPFADAVANRLNEHMGGDTIEQPINIYITNHVRTNDDANKISRDVNDLIQRYRRSQGV